MSTETILIVDDNREIVDSLGKLLALEGYDIITAYDGMEALEQLEKNKIDLILLDVMMPRLNGLSALMKIRESYKIPAIILSAKKNASEQKQRIMDYMETELAIESIIESKGLPDSFVLITESSISVTVDQQELDTNTVAKICDIVMRETGKSADKIVIQSKY